MQAMYLNNNIITPYCEGKHAHPGYNIEVLRDTVLAAFVTKGVVRPGRQVSKVLVV